MGSIEYTVEPSVDIPPGRLDMMEGAETQAEMDDPLAAARGVAWALIAGVTLWVGLYLVWRVVFG